MRKLFLITAVAVLGVFSLSAQPIDRLTHPLNVSIFGGGMVSFNENSFTYRDNNHTLGLLGPQGGIAVGYDITQTAGARLSVSYGWNSGACNVLQTAARGFYPYRFSSVNVFADMLVKIVTTENGFSPMVYGGVGLGHSFGFTDSGHPWQDVSPRNNAFGFRFGAIAQFAVASNVSLFIDLCGEAYTDTYNGLRPTAQDQADVDGYAGFPFDLRALLSFGCTYHF